MKLFRLDKYKNEDKLIEDCIAAIPQAQKYLFDKYAGIFLAVCLRYISDYQIAEDVLMESFMKIYSNLNKFNNKGSFEGWMRRIIVNESISYLRKNKSIHLSTDNIQLMDDETEIGESSENISADKLMNLINKLPDGYRTIFNLYAIEEYKHSEIAEMLNITESTSKSQLFKARSILKKEVKKLESVSDESVIVSISI
ncbi:MAG: RNA polymerase sigma factor [Bacteroidota bacterium]